MNFKTLAAAAALSLAAGAAFAASPNYGATTQPVAPQVTSGTTQTDPNVGGTTVYNPSVAAYPGERPHVIGGQTFYYGGTAGDGAAGDGSAD